MPVLLAAVHGGADLALGSRYVPGGGIEHWAAWRRAVSRAANGYARRVLRVPVRDLTGGLKCFRAEALEAIDFGTARARGYAFQVELTYRALRAGLRVVELPITFRERREGESKLTGPRRARGRLAGARAAAAAAAALSRGPGCRCTGHEEQREQLALVRGWDDTLSTLHRWRRVPPPRSGRGSRPASASRRCCCSRLARRHRRPRRTR